MPTGGINKANLAEYLEVPAVVACGDSTHPYSKIVHAANID